MINNDKTPNRLLNAFPYSYHRIQFFKATLANLKSSIWT